MNKKRLFFSLAGVEINDDDALAAFAQQVWENATALTDETSGAPFAQLQRKARVVIDPGAIFLQVLPGAFFGDRRYLSLGKEIEVKGIQRLAGSRISVSRDVWPMKVTGRQERNDVGGICER